MKLKAVIILFVLANLSLWMLSCKHDPMLLDDDMMPKDTIPIDTMMTDTMITDTTMVDTTGNGVPCDPDLVYFNTDILPLLNSNCAFSGCHDAASAEDGVILESYESVMATADVEAYQLDNSEIYEVLVDDDLGDRMPPPPTPALSQDQIQLIALWILQGAENLACDPTLSPCETTDVSFSLVVKPIMDIHCVGCHSGSPPSGGISLESHMAVKEVADTGQLLGAIKWEDDYENMPRNGTQLSACQIDQIESWIEEGALDN